MRRRGLGTLVAAAAAAPVLAALAVAGEDALPAPPAATPYVLRYDRLGYLPGARPWAVLLSRGEKPPAYRVWDLAHGAFLGAPRTGERALDATSRAGTRLTGDRLDLAGAAGPGRYLVVLEDGSRHGPIEVGPDVYAEVLPKVAKFLAAQRCGPTTVAISGHGPCHLFASIAGAHSGDAIAVDDGFAGPIGRDTGPAVDVEGGWHDAGDNVKFVGTTAFTLAVALATIRDHGAALGPARERLRGELRWGLDWLVKMAGGPAFYHQVSGEPDHRDDFRLPEADTQAPLARYEQRPVFRLGKGRGANLLGRAAAAFALGAQVYADDPPYAARLLTCARAAYAEAKKRPAAQQSFPPSFYAETECRDDLALGAAALARATGEAGFRLEALGYARALEPEPGEPLSWERVDALAFLETGLAFPPGAERADMAARLAALARPILASQKTPRGPGAAFRYARAEFGNGTIMESLGAAAAALAARRLGAASDEALAVAHDQLHWLFGQNPFGLSFMVGAGGAFPKNVHHNLARAGGHPLEGAIVGGPTGRGEIESAGVRAPPADGPFAAWSTDALLYEDRAEDYVVNEPAIDFTAPLLFVLGEISDAR
jgi:endoglucanase